MPHASALQYQPRRGFSSTPTETPAPVQSDNIFQSADYFAQDAALHQELVGQPVQMNKELPFVDDTDTLGTLMAVLPKDTSNVVQGISTYGLWEYVSYLDTTFSGMWMFTAENLGMGMGIGLVASSLFTKAIFAPFIIYSQMVGLKMKLLQPDQEELLANMKRYSQQGVRPD